VNIQQRANPLLVSVVLLALSACGAPAATTPVAQPAATQTVPTTTPASSSVGTAAATTFGVAATGEIVARQDVDLVFQVNGTVGQVLVTEGDIVAEGDLLAVLDTRTLDQTVRDAEAALVSARADVAALTEDPTPEEAAAAQAQIAQAQGQLAQTTGSVTVEDITAAQASLTDAQASLADLLDGKAKPEEIAQATAQRDAAAVQLEQSRNSLSQAKTQAQLGVEQATTALQQAQVRYSEAYWQWQYAQDKGAQPSDVERGPEPNLSDTGTQKVYNAYKQAELDLQNAEQSLRTAQQQLEQAQQAELDGIALAQRNLEGSQASLDLLLRPADADELAAAEARVASAAANLEKLQGQQRTGQLAAAQAAVASAQAQYDQLFADPTASQLAKAEANVARAEASLAQAQLNRAYAEIRAPFSGEVAVVNVDPGDSAPTSTAAGSGAIRLVDTSALYVELQVSDADVAAVRVGQQAEVVADALPGEVFRATVSFVAPTATQQNNVTSYLVKLELDDAASPLRAGMSVTANLLND
jgi:HlyD family secretion protein